MRIWCLKLLLNIIPTTKQPDNNNISVCLIWIDVFQVVEFLTLIKPAQMNIPHNIIKTVFLRILCQ